MDYLTITEAAEKLGVSKDTIRRRIKKGEITAELRDGPYGHQYYIPLDGLAKAVQIVNVTEVENVVPLDKLLQMAQEVISENVTQEIQSLREELAATKEELKEAIADLGQGKNKRPWWRFW